MKKVLDVLGKLRYTPFETPRISNTCLLADRALIFVSLVGIPNFSWNLASMAVCANRLLESRRAIVMLAYLVTPGSVFTSIGTYIFA